MERKGCIVKIVTDLYFSGAAADAAKDCLLEYLKTHNEITAVTLRDLLGAPRKFAIALLDHFDHSGVTTRVGDIRRLRTPNRSSVVRQMAVNSGPVPANQALSLGFDKDV